METGLYSEDYKNMWGVIVENGYQGLLDTVREINSKKCAPSINDLQWRYEMIEEKFSYMVVVENQLSDAGRPLFVLLSK